MTSTITRRGAIATMAGSAALGVTGIPAPATANGADAEFFALYEEYRKARAELDAAFNVSEAAEEAWRSSPDYLPSPKVMIRGYKCITEGDIETLVHDEAERDRFLADFQRQSNDNLASRARYGIPQADVVEARAVERELELYKRVGAAPVYTLDGVRTKLQILAEFLHEEEHENDAPFADTALEAIERLGDAS